MRDCARSIDGMYCGRPMTGTRVITVLAAASAQDDLHYAIDLCDEHWAEYDRVSV